MSRTRSPRHRSGMSSAALRNELETAGAPLMESVAAGCAIVAYCDGWVQPEETWRMRSLLARFAPAQKLGLSTTLDIFEDVSRRFLDDHDAGERYAFALVSRLTGRRRESDLLIETCCAIADADGGFDAEERGAILKMCELLDVDPAAHGL